MKQSPRGTGLYYPSTAMRWMRSDLRSRTMRRVALLVDGPAHAVSWQHPPTPSSTAHGGWRASATYSVWLRSTVCAMYHTTDSTDSQQYSIHNYCVNKLNRIKITLSMKSINCSNRYNRFNLCFNSFSSFDPSRRFFHHKIECAIINDKSTSK